MLQEKEKGEDEEEGGGVVPGGEGVPHEGSSEAGADLLVSYIGSLVTLFLFFFPIKLFLPLISMIFFTTLEKLW